MDTPFCERRALLRAMAGAGLAWAVPRVPAAPARPLAVLHDGGASLDLLEPDTLRTLAHHATGAPARRLLRLGGAVVLCGADGRLRQLAPGGGGWRSVSLGQGLPRAVASSDGRWLLAVSEAPASPPELWLLDAALQPLRRWPLPGPVGWVADAPGRRSFVLALSTRPEVWELSYDERASDFYDGLVHDYRMGEGVPQRGFHNVRRMPTPVPLRHGNFDAEHTELLAEGLVFNLDARRPLRYDATWRPAAAGAAALFEYQGRPALAVPVAGQAQLDILRTGDWTRLASVALAAPARAVRPAGPGMLLAVGDGAAADRLMPVACATLQALPPWVLPGPCQAEPLVDAADAADAAGAALWVLHGGAGAGLQRLEARNGRTLARRDLDDPLDLAWA